MNIFIAAAGYGERLRPITLDIAKPLLPILGRPIIDFVVEKAIALNPSNICINLHYKSDDILRWINSHPNRNLIKIYPELDLLGTGGALKNAETLLISEHVFVVHNADVFSDIDLSALVSLHQKDRYIATLCVVDFAPINSLHINQEGLLCALSDTQRQDCRKKTFTGIAIYSSEFLEFLPEGSSSVVEGWLRAIEAGHKINTHDVTGAYWSDIGSFDSYAQTVFCKMLKEGEQVYIDPSFKDCANLHYQGYVVIEKGCQAACHLTINNSILMPGTRIDDPSSISNCIIGNNYRISINPQLPTTLGSGGSDRSFRRITHPKGSAVKMQCKEGDSDYSRHIEYTNFFSSKGVPVPKILDYDDKEYWAVFEDLGDLSLYSWMRCKRSKESILKIYEPVLKTAVELHNIDLQTEEQTTAFRIFDYEYFLWESAYFLEHYIGGIRNMASPIREVKEELQKLAARASSFKRRIIHRDLQSQNIMIKDGWSIYFIDYQGARIGPPAYDIASLCYDPYAPLDDDIRKYLCELYIAKRVKRGDFDILEFRESLVICKMQRLMQALGAYSFLAIKKNKPYFIKHIPSALILLKQGALTIENDFPHLSRFIGYL